jgi:hypothetical protein
MILCYSYFICKQAKHKGKLKTVAKYSNLYRCLVVPRDSFRNGFSAEVNHTHSIFSCNICNDHNNLSHLISAMGFIYLFLNFKITRMNITSV